MEEQNKLAYFEGKEIRKVWYDKQWYFSIVNVIEVVSKQNYLKSDKVEELPDNNNPI